MTSNDMESDLLKICWTKTEDGQMCRPQQKEKWSNLKASKLVKTTASLLRCVPVNRGVSSDVFTRYLKSSGISSNDSRPTVVHLIKLNVAVRQNF